jgi:hypothetical protein
MTKEDILKLAEEYSLDYDVDVDEGQRPCTIIELSKGNTGPYLVLATKTGKEWYINAYGIPCKVGYQSDDIVKEAIKELAAE